MARLTGQTRAAPAGRTTQCLGARVIGRTVPFVSGDRFSRVDTEDDLPTVVKKRSVDPLLVLGCLGGTGVFVAALVVANGIVNSEWSLIGSGLFDRGSDSGALGEFLAAAFVVVLGVVVVGVAVAIQAWKYRKAASAATAAAFERHVHIEDGHGRTGAGHIGP